MDFATIRRQTRPVSQSESGADVVDRVCIHRAGNESSCFKQFEHLYWARRYVAHIRRRLQCVAINCLTVNHLAGPIDSGKAPFVDALGLVCARSVAFVLTIIAHIGHVCFICYILNKWRWKRIVLGCLCGDGILQVELECVEDAGHQSLSSQVLSLRRLCYQFSAPY